MNAQVELPILGEFGKECESTFACFLFASKGIENLREIIRSQSSPPNARLFISETDPTSKRATATILVADAIKKMEADGEYFDRIAKALHVLLYSRWDEYYRKEVGRVIGVAGDQVRCDLMGDLRHIRNCIVHAKSIITKEHNKIKCLCWDLKPGHFSITKRMLADFIEQTHTMTVYVDTKK